MKVNNLHTEKQKLMADVQTLENMAAQAQDGTGYRATIAQYNRRLQEIDTLLMMKAATVEGANGVVCVSGFDPSPVLNPDHLMKMYHYLNYHLFGNVLHPPKILVYDFSLQANQMAAYDHETDTILFLRHNMAREYYNTIAKGNKIPFQRFVYMILCHEIMHQKLRQSHLMTAGDPHDTADWKDECHRLATLLGIEQPQTDAEYRHFPRLLGRLKT